MKTFIPLMLLFGLFIFTSCATNKMLTSAVRSNEITNLQKFEPVSYISLIEKANQAKYNDTLSTRSKELFSNVLNSFGVLIPLTGEIKVNETLTQQRLAREIEALCVAADEQKSLANLRLTPRLDSVLEVNGKRFGLITITTGFTRKRGNYGKQIAKGIGLGVLTLGMVYTAPVKSYSIVYAMIVDSEDDNVAFFRKSILADKDPLDESVLKKQVLEVFDGYFWSSK